MALGTLTATVPAHAVQADLTSSVSVVPASTTPQVQDGVVNTIAQVGGEMFLGGSFTQVSPPAGSPVSTHHYVVGFDASSGALDNSGFRPSLNGVVNVVAAGPRANEVYVGGDFTTVDGRSMRLALLDTNDGSIVSSWDPSKMDGPVDDLVLENGQLFVGGGFTTVGGDPHGGLAVLNPSSGQVTSYADLSFTGHHNYGRNCDPSTDPKCVSGRVGIKAMDINPAQTKLVVVGNFTRVAGADRDQIAVVNLGANSATLDTRWATEAYTGPCLVHAFDGYLRDVQFSPDGKYFAVVASGGLGGLNYDKTKPGCDSASRWETNASGSNVRPTWIDFTGEDSLLSVSVTDAAVYIGGHQRFVNNPQGQNLAAEGAIARPGIAALSPMSGLPLLWNPGRNPRGAGTYALLATAKGLWVGSDTDCIGTNDACTSPDHPNQYLRKRIAFFPAGGLPATADATPRLPGQVYLVGATNPPSDRLLDREFDGTFASDPGHQLSTGIAWGSVRGAFTVDGNVIYGKPDGGLYERSFNGTSFGPESVLDPWNDPTWNTVKTGDGDTYQGLASTFVSEIPNLTSMFFHDGRLYYTQADKKGMDWRWFQPQSGAVGADEFAVSDGKDWTDTAGAFLSGSHLYYAKQSNGDLYSVAFAGGEATGASTLVSSAGDWASRGLFALSQADAPTTTPVAQATGSCSAATCTFSATAWVDPDGGQTKYAWNYGDGTAKAPALAPAGLTAKHTFLRNGPHTVTLTVSDTAGAKATATVHVTVAAPVAKIRFVGASTGTSTTRTVHVVVPARVKVHDALLMYASYHRAHVTSAPKGWKVLGRKHRGTLTTVVYVKVATSHDARRKLTFRFSRKQPASLTVVAYANTSSRPIEAVASSAAGAARLHRAPKVTRVVAGSWVDSYWTQTASKVFRWTPPHGTKRRAVTIVHGRPALGSLLVDSGKARVGTVSLGLAKSSRASTAVVAWTIALAPAIG